MRRPQIKIEGDRKRDGWVYNRVATSAEWAAYPYPLELGEIGYDSTTNTIKIGNGTAMWGGLTSLSGGNGSVKLDDGSATIDGTFIIDDGNV